MRLRDMFGLGKRRTVMETVRRVVGLSPSTSWMEVTSSIVNGGRSGGTKIMYISNAGHVTGSTKETLWAIRYTCWSVTARSTLITFTGFPEQPLDSPTQKEN